MEHEINKETLNKLLEYIPETGDLIWKKRDIEWFKSEKDCKSWNARYAEKKALNSLVNVNQNDNQRDHLTYYGSLLNKTVRKSRVIWVMHYGEIPDKMQISFKDLNPLNCKIENLEMSDIANVSKKKEDQLQQK